MKVDCQILGLLQNQWAKDPARMKALLERHPTERYKVIGMLLAFSASGRHLRRVFGAMMERIIWDNVSPVIAPAPNACPPPDLVHVCQVLRSVQPDIVIAFGRNAQVVMRQQSWSGCVICAPHPASRQAGVHEKLVGARDRLLGCIAEHTENQHLRTEN